MRRERQFKIPDDDNRFKREDKDTRVQRKIHTDEDTDKMISVLKDTEGGEETGRELLANLNTLNKVKKSPLKLIKYCVTSKSRTSFEEIKSRELTEDLCWNILDYLNGRANPISNNHILFRFLSLQNTSNIKTKSLSKKLISTCLSLVGRFLNQDRFILTLIHKMMIRNVEDVKQSKYEITERLLSIFFLYFTFLQDPQQRSSTEFLRNYADILKFFTYFTKELTDLKSVPKQKYVSDDVYEYLNCLVEMCKMNMCLGVKGLEKQVFDGQNKALIKLIGAEEVKSRISRVQLHEKKLQPETDSPDPQNLMSSDHLSSCYSTSESQSEKVLSEQETEFLEKVKSSSAKVISSLLKVFPKLFIDNKLWVHILPLSSVSLPKPGSFNFVPQILYIKDYYSNLRNNHSSGSVNPKSIKKEGFETFEFDLDLKKVNSLHRTSTGEDAQFFEDSASQNLAQLTNMKARLLGEMKSKGKLD